MQLCVKFRIWQKWEKRIPMRPYLNQIIGAGSKITLLQRAFIWVDLKKVDLICH